MVPLSVDDTDVTSAYISSFSTSNNLTKTGNTIVLPASAIKNDNNDNLTDSSQFSMNGYSYVFNSGNKTNCGTYGQSIPCYSYYSWDAATLGSGRNITTRNTEAEYSICPKGWRLPKTKYANPFDSTLAVQSDTYLLGISYGMPTGAWSGNITDIQNRIGPGTIPNYIYNSNYSSGFQNDSGIYGYYWSSTFCSSYTCYYGLGSSSFMSSKNNNGSRYGMGIRCLLK